MKDKVCFGTLQIKIRTVQITFQLKSNNVKRFPQRLRLGWGTENIISLENNGGL